MWIDFSQNSTETGHFDFPWVNLSSLWFQGVPWEEDERRPAAIQVNGDGVGAEGLKWLPKVFLFKDSSWPPESLKFWLKIGQAGNSGASQKNVMPKDVREEFGQVASFLALCHASYFLSVVLLFEMQANLSQGNLSKEIKPDFLGTFDQHRGGDLWLQRQFSA